MKDGDCGELLEIEELNRLLEVCTSRRKMLKLETATLITPDTRYDANQVRPDCAAGVMLADGD